MLSVGIGLQKPLLSSIQQLQPEMLTVFSPVLSSQLFPVAGQLLLKNILKPLISHPTLKPLLEEQSDSATLRLESVGTSLGHPSPVEVFAKIKLVLELLHKHQLGTESVSVSESWSKDVCCAIVSTFFFLTFLGS